MLRNCIKSSLFLLFVSISIFTLGVPAKAQIISFDEDDDRAKALKKVDYDCVVAVGSYNILMLAKNITGFDVNETHYGIYDAYSEEWLLDYIELPTSDIPRVNLSGSADDQDIYIDFSYHQDGVFSYQYYDGWTTYDCFVSADAGGYFLLTVETVPDEIIFNNGSALVVLYDDVKGYVEGYIPPDNKLCWITTSGEIIDFSISGYDFERENPERFAYFSPHDYGSGNLYAYTFHNIEHEKYMVIYDPEWNQTFFIQNTSYLNRLVSESEVNIVFKNESESFISVKQLLGEDGNYYYAIFDQNGELVVEAQIIPEEVENGIWDFPPNESIDTDLVGIWKNTVESETVEFRDDWTIYEDLYIDGEIDLEEKYVLDKSNHILAVYFDEKDYNPVLYAVTSDYLFLDGGDYVYERIS